MVIRDSTAVSNPPTNSTAGTRMTIDEILQRLADGATLQGPHWTEPVKVLAIKARGSRVEVQAVGLHTKRLWNKLLRAEDFDEAIKITPTGEQAALTGNPNHIRLAAEQVWRDLHRDRSWQGRR